jgi:hypothetical protein
MKTKVTLFLDDIEYLSSNPLWSSIYKKTDMSTFEISMYPQTGMFLLLEDFAEELNFTDEEKIFVSEKIDWLIIEKICLRKDCLDLYINDPNATLTR